ncbi:MAG: DEAD/DEAH box helicase [Parahaliea sp.]
MSGFATNLLGTCKHIEFLLGHLERRRSGKAALRRGFQPQYSEVWLRYGAQRHICFTPGQACPAALLKRAQALFDPGNGWQLSAEGLDKLEDFLAATRRSRHEVRCYQDALAFAAESRAEDARRGHLAELYPQGPATPALRDLLSVPLYPYQCEGALFAAAAGRAIIADDMGLGKTIQAIAAAEILLRHSGVRRVLVVCPTSLKHQWHEEVSRLCGRTALVVDGPQRERAAQFAQPAVFKITNYDTVRRDLDLINAWEPDLVIADEAQRIKNWDTKAARAMKQVRSRHALVLTGTPLENRLRELVSVVQFVDQHRLGPTWRFLERHQIVAEGGQVVGYQRLDEVARTLQPILIRRRKAEVLTQLPPRRNKVYLLPLGPAQRALHEENAETVARIVARWKKRHFLSEKDQNILRAALQNMRMVCDSTYLLDPRRDEGAKIPELLRVLDELLADPDVKVVIFSQWLRSHELLSQALAAAGYGHVLFHGGVPSRQRGALVERFRAEPQCRVFLATDAGGVGLNLQCASVVMNLDLPWNPAVLEQRIGRAHRLGQHRSVQVFNFVAESSIEHNLMGLLEFKQSLAAGVLDGGEKEVHLGGSQLTRFMESVERITGEASTEPRLFAPMDDVTPTLPAVRAAQGQAATEQDVVENSAPGESHPPAKAQVQPASPWQALFDLGQTLLAEMAAEPSSSHAGPGGSLVRRDAKTGERYLHVPVPDHDTVTRLADLLRDILNGR